jgi:formaldehyde-activating enzyme involved in methanogenesis
MLAKLLLVGEGIVRNPGKLVVVNRQRLGTAVAGEYKTGNVSFLAVVEVIQAQGGPKFQIFQNRILRVQVGNHPFLIALGENLVGQ